MEMPQRGRRSVDFDPRSLRMTQVTATTTSSAAMAKPMSLNTTPTISEIEKMAARANRTR